MPLSVPTEMQSVEITRYLFPLKILLFRCGQKEGEQEGLFFGVVVILLLDGFLLVCTFQRFLRSQLNLRPKTRPPSGKLQHFCEYLQPNSFEY